MVQKWAVVTKKGWLWSEKGGGGKKIGSGHGDRVDVGGGDGRSSPHFIYIVCKYEY